MHYNGPIIRPPHEAYSLMLETTVGCTHNSCRFCTFYKDAPFHMAPLSQVETDLQEVATPETGPRASLVFRRRSADLEHGSAGNADQPDPQVSPQSKHQYVWPRGQYVP